MALGLVQSSVLAADTSTGDSVPSQDSEGTYLIENADQLLWFSAETKAGRLLDANVKLIADIDLNRVSWTSIATGAKNDYSGTFDGNSNKITVTGASIFSTITAGAVVKNLTVEGTVTCKGTSGLIVGTQHGGLIENCISRVTIEGANTSSVIGGIVGQMDEGTIKDCVNYSSITAPESKMGSNASNIYGGIIGKSSDKGTTSPIISGCINYGDIKSNYFAGGIAGLTKSPTIITNCKNFGSMSSEQQAGGMVAVAGGSVDDPKRLDILNCENNGAIIALKEEAYVGGLVGRLGATGKGTDFTHVLFENVVNNAIVQGGVKGVFAGFFREGTEATYTNCYYLDDGSNNPNGIALTGKASLKEIAVAKDVSSAIDKLGTITLGSESAINEVSTAYNALNDVQKSLVKNAGAIETAKATLEELKKSQVKEPDPQPEPGKPEVNPEPEKPAEGVAPSAEAVQEALNNAKEAVAGVDEAASLGLAKETPKVNVSMVSEAGEPATVIPAEVLETVKGKDVDVVFEMDNYTWTVNGTNVTAEEVKALNLGVEKVSGVVPESIVEELAQGNPTVQLRLSHEGDFGFKATLRYNFGSEYAGKYANVYWCKEDGSTQITTSGLIDSDGYAELAFTHASDYVVVLSNDNKAAENVLDAEITNNDANVTASPKTGDAANISLILSLFALCILAGSAVKSKKEAN
ncbi:MAG: hypothetical protein E7241_02815 [Lachnospiraceae bacterium]|jgi:hypothetical protein|nr:hypothetical protein [Lachnospiraceae bacterium]